MKRNRREFLDDVGSGMLIAGLGVSLAGDLGVSSAFAGEGSDALSFGKLQRLVGLMQETPAEKLQPMLVDQLRSGQTDLRRLVAAAALANAETFGGQDYVGFHTEMALLPAWEMSKEISSPRRPLPILKVLYRNAQRIQKSGLAKNKTLKTVTPADLPDSPQGGKLLRDATRAADMQQAEQIFAAQVNRSKDEAFNNVLWAVQDASNVHRFCLAHRAWGLIDVVGQEHAHTMLRQCVRFCVENEQYYKKAKGTPLRPLIPKLVDQYRLLDRKPGARQPDDAWLEETSNFIYSGSGEQAMEVVAAALSEGFAPEAVGQAISLAANQLVLRQDRLKEGSWRIHGATPGVHASDAMNAWRNMARMTNRRNTIVGLLVGAYHTGVSKCYTDGDPYPLAEHRQAIQTTDAKSLLREAEAAIRENDQGRASAAIAIYGEQGYAPRAVFELLLRYGISEDGRLHAEKYYRTVTEEFATTRPAFRWRHLVGLARVTASSYGFDVNDRAGYRAPGYEQACRLLNVDA